MVITKKNDYITEPDEVKCHTQATIISGFFYPSAGDAVSVNYIPPPRWLISIFSKAG